MSDRRPRKAIRDEKWARYEALAEKILTDMMPFAEVRRDDKIRGRESEAERQIDVSARWEYGGQDYLTVVQVRDRRRPADVNTVGEFRSVLMDVGASKGVLVCSGGFSKQAINMLGTWAFPCTASTTPRPRTGLQS